MAMMRLRSLNDHLPDLEPGMIAGRSRSSDATLLDTRYSAQHFRLQGDTLVDMSTNGVFVNGMRVAKGEPVELYDGDIVTLTVKDESAARRVFGDDLFAAWVVHCPERPARHPPDGAERITQGGVTSAPLPAACRLSTCKAQAGETMQARCIQEKLSHPIAAAVASEDVDEFSFDLEIAHNTRAAEASCALSAPAKRMLPAAALGMRKAAKPGPWAAPASANWRAPNSTKQARRQDDDVPMIDSIFAQIKSGRPQAANPAR
mmetsp:Transcript_20570/g.53164  ORF Transcript_20570/g.53164 Transcript_20570/m.53164 type:complete len:261 (-) Transcript_20570:26-808(-)